jgi:hypothetical protein
LSRRERCPPRAPCPSSSNLPLRFANDVSLTTEWSVARARRRARTNYAILTGEEERAFSHAGQPHAVICRSREPASKRRWQGEMSSEGSYFPREMREQPDAIRDSLAETASARETLAERASEANRALIVVAAEGTVERELLVANYASRQGAAVAVVGKPEAGDGWPGDSLRLSVPMEGLAPRSSALVAMVPLHLLGAELSKVRGKNMGRPEDVNVEYLQDLLYGSTFRGGDSRRGSVYTWRSPGKEGLWSGVIRHLRLTRGVH